jgi:flagellar protein FliL
MVVKPKKAQEVRKVAEVEPGADATPKKKGMLIPLIIGLVLAITGGAGGYWAATSGPLGGSADSAGYGDQGSGLEDASDAETVTYIRPELEEVAFVPLDPMVITIGSGGQGRQLLFTAELEVAPDDADQVANLLPRVLDVLNSYLRVIDMQELNDPRTLVRLRAQLLRRIQIVTGDVLVRDLLVTEFVVN